MKKRRSTVRTQNNGLLTKIYEDFRTSQNNKERKEIKFRETQIRKDLEKIKVREKEIIIKKKSLKKKMKFKN